MRTPQEIRAVWLSHLLSKEPADRPRAESALRELYISSGFSAPEHFFWLDSPFAALWAAMLLSAPHDSLKHKFVEGVERHKREREYVDRVRAALSASAPGRDWDSVLAIAGEPLSGQPVRFRIGAAASIKPTIESALLVARLQLYDDPLDSTLRLDESDELYRAERHFFAVLGGQAEWGAINPLIGSSFFGSYRFSTMAQDEAAASDRAVPGLISAAWEIARSSGPWWPFSRSAVISDRPIEMHLNDASLLHRGGGPAAEYRDGTRLWAWNGHAMREEWIMHPERISARDLKEFDSTFREYAAARSGVVRPGPKVKTSSILKKALQGSIEDRIGALGKHNKNQLPLYDRYLAGEYEKVWSELIALGPSVRADPNAADLLAVAYETMRRVEANVRRISAELQALGYRANSELHTPPGPTVNKQLARLERKIGVLPASIRAFYEIVGAVDWTGEHPSLAASGDSIAPDPLVVFPVEDLIAQCDAGFGDGAVLAIAPDDLHKSNTSGGEPYEIEVPNMSADGKLLNERHDLYFVEYLRLVFRFGGFPGYDGIDRAVPVELKRLRSIVIPF